MIANSIIKLFVGKLWTSVSLVNLKNNKGHFDKFSKFKKQEENILKFHNAYGAENKFAFLI